MRLQSSMVDLVAQGLAGQLPTQAKWDKRPALGIVVASKGYPESSSKGDVISGLPEIDGNSRDETVKVFHAGTAFSNDINNADVDGNEKQVVTSGGRVLCVTALGDTINSDRENAYNSVAAIDWQGMFYRRDIGWRAIDR